MSLSFLFFFIIKNKIKGLLYDALISEGRAEPGD